MARRYPLVIPASSSRWMRPPTAGPAYHHAGPAAAVLPFAVLARPGGGGLRIARGAVIFARWRRAWRYFQAIGGAERRTALLLGIVLAARNACFYLAMDGLPLATVG